MIFAPLASDMARSISNVAGLVAVIMFLSLAWTLGTTITWLQAAIVVFGVIHIIWAVREGTKDTETERDRSAL